MYGVKPIKILKYLYWLVRDTLKKFSHDKAFRHGAAISYYTIFSLPAVLIIIINLASLFFGEQAVTTEVYQQIEGFLGKESADEIQGILGRIHTDKNSTWATILGIVTLIFGATGVFYSLRDSLNVLWDLPEHIQQGSFLKVIFDRLLSFTVVISLGFIFLVSMVLNALIVALQRLIQGWSDEMRAFIHSISDQFGTYADQLEIIIYIAYVLDAIVGIVVITLTFALIFKFLSDAVIAWKDVWLGALFTAVLFNLGKFLIGWYIGSSNVSSTYGAAGSVVLIMIWVYYSSQILLLGAEFIYVYVKSQGREIKPTRFSTRLVDEPLLHFMNLIKRTWRILKNIYRATFPPKPVETEPEKSSEIESS